MQNDELTYSRAFVFSCYHLSSSLGKSAKKKIEKKPNKC